MQSGGSGIGEWRQHWTLLMPCTLGSMLGAVPTFTLGVMIRPLEQEYGWTRVEISSGPFMIALIALVGAPLVGMATDRFGVRRIAVPGVLVFCSALALCSTATSSIWSWWLLWVALGIAAMMVLPSIWTLAVNSFFDRNRGKALAITLSGTGIGAFSIPPLTNYLIDTYGWRGAFVGLGAILAAICFPLTLFFFRSASDVLRKTKESGSADTVVLSGMTAREGFVTLRFYLLAGAAVIFSTAIVGLVANLTPILIARGLTPARAAAVAGLMGIGSILGRLVGGILIDRWDAKKVAAISVLTACGNVGLLLAFPGSIEAAIAATFILGLALGIEYNALVYLAARHFGMRALGLLYGTITGLLMFATGLAPMIANHVYDVTRSYHLYLWGVIPAFVVTALLFLSLGRYPDFRPAEQPA